METLRTGAAVAAAVLIATGMLVPVAHAPVVGDLSYRRLAEGEFVLVLVLAAGAVGLALLRRFRLLWLPAVAILAVLLNTARDIGSRVAEVRRTAGEIGGGPLRDLVDAAVETVDPRWGIGLLLGGVVLLALPALPRPR